MPAASVKSHEYSRLPDLGVAPLMASIAGRGMDARPDLPTHRAMESGLLLYPPLAVHLVAKIVCT